MRRVVEDALCGLIVERVKEEVWIVERLGMLGLRIVIMAFVSLNRVRRDMHGVWIIALVCLRLDWRRSSCRAVIREARDAINEAMHSFIHSFARCWSIQAAVIISYSDNFLIR